MFKNSWSNRLFTGRKSPNHRQNQTTSSHGNSKSKQDFLSNIVEEGSMEDLPKTFEQEEEYLNECLNSMSSSVEDVPNNSEVEEYDFDDFNSIASTTSMLNLAVDNDDRLRITSPPPPRSTPGMAKTVPNGYITPRNGTIHMKRAVNGTDNLTHYQNSISKVHNWDRLGKGGGQEDWNQVLLQAAEAGELITVQNAVSHLGATKESLINARDSAGNTPLHKAAQYGKLQCLKWLVKRAPNEAVTITNHDDVTPAAMAIQYGKVECLEWLVDQTGARQELEKENSFSLLHYAAKEGQEECLRFLLSYISPTMDISEICDSNGVTPAHLAAREGHLECLQTLVEFNTDVTFKDREGCTPSDRAFKTGQTGCGHYLVVVETCIELFARLSDSRKENEELRNRLRILESYSHIHMPDRPEVVGGDQSDSSSTISMDSVIYSGSKVGKYADTRRSSSAPDGESPKGTKKEGTAYDFQTNSMLVPTSKIARSQSRDERMRRRGSFPLTCWEKTQNEDIDDQQDNNYKSINHSQPFREPSRNGRLVVPSSSPRTPSCSTGTSPSNARVHFEDAKETGLVSKAFSRNSESLSSTSSSRSQSPLKSDRSTCSSNETVLEQQQASVRESVSHNRGGSGRYDHVGSRSGRNDRVDSRIYDRIESNLNHVGIFPGRYDAIDSNYVGGNSGRHDLIDSGRHDRVDYRTPSDRHMDYDRLHTRSVHMSNEKTGRYGSFDRNNNHKQETDKTWKEDIRLRNGFPPKALQVQESTNQQPRSSWHGPGTDKNQHSKHTSSAKDKMNGFELSSAHDSANQRAANLSTNVTNMEDRIKSNNHLVHDVTRSNNWSTERRAQVSWSVQRGRGPIVMTRDKSKERDGPHRSQGNYFFVSTPLQENVSFGSSFIDSEDKPWYETEQVEL